jgi:hypothetical protein
VGRSLPSARRERANSRRNQTKIIREIAEVPGRPLLQPAQSRLWADCMVGSGCAGNNLGTRHPTRAIVHTSTGWASDDECELLTLAVADANGLGAVASPR